ncbi:uncharacterized protein N7458_010119 [Penicillium daleae]|uniref:Uncharacterized protein n=1 Tax=Penicillium daleae TaxID=63821 RepID=A0AAD6FZS0_9EURO|nr:uncharacterized protein N7458_010119 [Penicillium daleae]KAJ5439121.1 hypothetical protein N7458_010119 [Penicillium daleae]
MIARDSDNSNGTSSLEASQRPSVLGNMPPTEEFCDTNADCDYGYRCDDSGMCVRKGDVREFPDRNVKKAKRVCNASSIILGASGEASVALDTVGWAHAPEYLEFIS